MQPGAQKEQRMLQFLTNKESIVTEVECSLCRAVVVIAGFYWGNSKPTTVFLLIFYFILEYS